MRLEPIDISIEELEQLVEKAGRQPVLPDEQQKLKAAVRTLDTVATMLAEQDTTIQELRELLLGYRTSEKIRKVFGDEAPSERASNTGAADDSKRKGHGRNGADDYPGAERVPVSHPSLQAGDSCPECPRGTVYKVSQPGVLLRFVGQPPVRATVYELEKLRCGSCGTVFTANTLATSAPFLTVNSDPQGSLGHFTRARISERVSPVEGGSLAAVNSSLLLAIGDRHPWHILGCRLVSSSLDCRVGPCPRR